MKPIKVNHQVQVFGSIAYLYVLIKDEHGHENHLHAHAIAASFIIVTF